jgi:large conductance mechanosensitive channel
MVLNIHIGIINLSLKYGAFLTDVINFLIMAFIIFMIVKFMNKLLHKEKEEKIEEPKKSDEVLLLEEIRDLLKK